MIQRTIDVKLTADELAYLFAELGDNEQAEFFDTVAGIFDGWPGPWSAMQQMHGIGDKLSDRAKTLLAEIAPAAVPEIVAPDHVRAAIALVHAAGGFIEVKPSTMLVLPELTLYAHNNPDGSRSYRVD